MARCWFWRSRDCGLKRRIWTGAAAAFVAPHHPLPQLEDELATPEGVKRKSNSGYRKLAVEDQALLFLTRLRRGIPFEGLSLLFGVSAGTANNTFKEVLCVFNERIVPRVMDPLSGPQIDDMTPAQFKADLPGAKFIVDLTGFPCKSKENLLLGRLLWSAYHHRSEVAAVFGKIGFGEDAAQARACSPTTLPQ